MGSPDGVFLNADCVQRRRCVRRCPKKALTAEA
jgi:NAD-dependent dihydropyrimidine dehydrogenase PreA subunit